MRQDILLEQKIGLRLSRLGLLSKLYAIQSFAKAGHELRPEQFTVLYALKENNGMYMRQLADITFKDRPNMTRIVSILETLGYLTATIDSEGRQVKKLYVTEKGLQVCEETLPVVLNIWENSIENIDEDEINQFLITLNKIEDNIKKKTLIKV